MEQKILSFGFLLIFLASGFSLKAEKNENPPPCHTLTISGTNVSCHGSNDGTAAISISGGSGNFTITWSNGETNVLTIDSLTAGYYDVTVLDNSTGCNRIAVINITEPDPVELSIQTSNVNCRGDSTGRIDLTVTGGNGNYSYSWTNGNNSKDLVDVPAGNYSCTVTDAVGCSAQISGVITQPQQALGSNFSSTEVSCHNNADATIDIDVWGGTPSYYYDWNTGKQTQDLDSLSAGTYTLTITDVKGCTVTETINISNPPELNYTSSTTNNDCYGEHKGTIDVSVSGGIKPYSYEWHDSNYALSYDTSFLDNLPKNDYFLTVTDAHGCSFTESFKIESSEEIKIEIDSVVDASAYGASNGGIYVDVTGGTGAYTFNWSNGAGTEDNTGLVAGNYTLEVIDANSCSKTKDFMVDQPTGVLEYTYTKEDVSCYNSSDGSIQIYPTGGVKPYNINWSTGSANNYVTDIQSGVYYCTLTDENGTVYVDSVIVEEPDQISISFTKSEVKCFGGNSGSIDISVTGGTQPYAYQWYDPDYALAGISQDIDSARAGKYIVQVTDTNDCQSERTISISQPKPIDITLTGEDVKCYGASTGNINAEVDGGTEPYSYSWSNSSTDKNLNNLPAGTYKLTVTDDEACEAFSEITLTQSEEIYTSLVSTPVSCNAQSDGAAAGNVSGGSGDFEYNWSTGESTERIEDIDEGIYTLTVSDIFNCQKTDSVYVDKIEIDCINIPSSFTPNGDSYNDKWVIKNIYLFPECSMKVFNKWGNIVFESDGYAESWDGKYNGKILPSGTYYYIFKLSPDHKERTGSVTILK